MVFSHIYAIFFFLFFLYSRGRETVKKRETGRRRGEGKKREWGQGGREREKETDSTPIFWFIFEMITMDRTKLGRSLGLGIQSMYPTWLAGAQLFESSHTVS